MTTTTTTRAPILKHRRTTDAVCANHVPLFDACNYPEDRPSANLAPHQSARTTAARICDICPLNTGCAFRVRSQR